MSNTKDDGERKKKALTSAPPPWHSVLLIVVMGGFFVATLPSLDTLDEAATMETFTQIVFPEYLTLWSLAWIRMAIAISIWSVTIHTSVLSEGWVQETSYSKHSKLIMTPLKISGWKTLAPFTSISWNLLGLSFSLSSYIAFQATQNQDVSPWILRTALCVWSVAAPNTLLVAAVIRYAIWPAVLAKGNSTAPLKSVRYVCLYVERLERMTRVTNGMLLDGSIRNVFMHNINVFYAVSESALLGGLPVRWSELSLAPLVGFAYVIFSWNATLLWNKPFGPQFIYFFFDTTVPGYGASIALLALLFALILFFALFYTSELLLHWIDGGLLASLGFVGILCAAVMRFRDY